jgi:hypothetical protein
MDSVLFGFCLHDDDDDGEREGEGREVGSSCCFIRGIKMMMMVTFSSLLGKALI